MGGHSSWKNARHTRVGRPTSRQVTLARRFIAGRQDGQSSSSPVRTNEGKGTWVQPRISIVPPGLPRAGELGVPGLVPMPRDRALRETRSAPPGPSKARKATQSLDESLPAKAPARPPRRPHRPPCPTLRRERPLRSERPSIEPCTGVKDPDLSGWHSGEKFRPSQSKYRHLGKPCLPARTPAAPVPVFAPDGRGQWRHTWRMTPMTTPCTATSST